MLQQTLTKFGYPETLLKQYNHWAVLLRPQQVTLGSIIIISNENAEKFSDISEEGFAELKQVTSKVESVLKLKFCYDKINYLMLMMVDPEVHFHVIPRYSKKVEFFGTTFDDHGWPGAPNLGKVNDLEPIVFRKLASDLAGSFAAPV